MLRDSEEATTWLRTADPVKSWIDWQMALDKEALLSNNSVKTVEFVEKVDETKLARDVDDLSAIFEGLVDGADLLLPCDDLKTDGGEAASAAWIDNLDDDTMNVNDLSEAFDALVAEQSEVVEAATDVTESTVDSSSEEEDDEEMGDYDSDEEDASASARAINVKIIPSAPVWATMAPLDPRSCIRTPVFKDMDSRIPRIVVPRMDLSFGRNGASVEAAGPAGPSRCVQSMSPKREKAKVVEYRHNPETCWICKSSKSPEKKRALHRFLEKRTRRNWKRGPRYSGRSHVATSRVRNGGRFICTTRWI
ncbi:hypothetical protein BBJ28_00016598 [Nothophytophthora sp. Chile5]|nr:hypothetical protein BBJ28_00016598 [Nothophytophthora sp. Chile5]